MSDAETKKTVGVRLRGMPSQVQAVDYRVALDRVGPDFMNHLAALRGRASKSC